MNKKPNSSVVTAELRRRAEARLRRGERNHRSQAGDPKSEADPQRLLHELEVHQVELELQNAELQKARDELEVTLEKYTDLYDFAPIGYFSLDEQSRIQEVNLTGAALLGVERSRLINRGLLRFVVPSSQPIFLAFLKRIFTGTGKPVCEAALLKKDAAVFWANFHGTPPLSGSRPPKGCRVAVSDITFLKQAEETQQHLEAMAVKNQELRREIARRQVVEEALKKSEQHQSRLLGEARLLQEQLRHLSRQVLMAQEEERKKISRDLHDDIAQTLTGINVHLAGFKTEAPVNIQNLKRRITRTQGLVEKSVNLVQRFARELRPTMLDDLGLIPALHSYLKDFTKQTGIRIRFTAFAKVEQMRSTNRTVLYRVAQSALTNIARHSQASLVSMSIQKLPAAVRLQIHDNGKGFQVERLLLVKGRKRLGLLGMRERVEMVNGSFNIESTPGRGTTIRAQIPILNGDRI